MGNLIELRGTKEELKPLNNLENELENELKWKEPLLILCENSYHIDEYGYPLILVYDEQSTHIRNYSSNISLLTEGLAFISSPLTSKKYENAIPIHLITKGNYNPIDELLRKQKDPKVKIIKEERFEGERESKNHLIYYSNKISIGKEQISKRLSEIFSHPFQYRNSLI